MHGFLETRFPITEELKIKRNELADLHTILYYNHPMKIAKIANSNSLPRHVTPSPEYPV